MDFTKLIVGLLAVWRLTHLFGAEDGPWNLIFRLRKAAGEGFWGGLMDCFGCLSLWIAVPFAVWIGCDGGERTMTWLALSGGAMLLQRATEFRGEKDSARYYEEEGRNAVLWQEEADARSRQS